MWIFLNNAFVSIVQDPQRADGLVVRARLDGDLERLFPGKQVISLPFRDYAFRTFVSKAEVAEVLSKQVLGIDYGNFKGSVEDRARHDAYLGVWSVMWRAQEAALRPSRRDPFFEPMESLDFGDPAPKKARHNKRNPRRN